MAWLNYEFKAITLKTIEKKIKAVQERVKRLEQLSATLHSFGEYQATADAKDIAERNIQVAIGGCLDIAKIVISSRELSEPKYNKAFLQCWRKRGL